jgi:hypothetical protein
MNIQRVAVTITLNVDLCNLPEGVTHEQVAEMMTHDMWNEGRYPFYSEMLHVGLSRSLKQAIGKVVSKKMMAECGNQVVVNGNSTTALWHIKTEEMMKGVGAYVNDSIKAARIEVVDEL